MPASLTDGVGSRGYVWIALLVSFALLCAQVTVTRLLAYRLFYHFVFFVISLSQLGLAAAGAWIYASRRGAWTQRDLVRWLLVMAVLPLVVLACYSWLGPPPNISGKLDGSPAHRYLVLLSVPLVALNFAGGMVLTILFTSFKAEIGRLYASDLLGAAIGCVGSVGLMMAVGPITAFLCVGVAALVALVLLLLSGARPSRSQWAFAAVATLALAAALASPRAFDPYVLIPAMTERIQRSEWNHIARTDAERPGLYVIDGDAATDLMEGGPRPPAPDYALVPPSPAVAIIGVGAGPQLRAALMHGASDVLAIDINPTIMRWNLGQDRGANRGLFHDPRVHTRVGEGRHVLRSSERAFDLIVMHAIDTWTASSQGAYSLSENFLYTTEAMGDYLSRLRPGGVLSLRRWLFWPPRENLRLFTTAFEALERAGIEHPEDHLVVLAPHAKYGDPGLQVWGYLFVSNRPFTERRLVALSREVEQRGWRYLYRPGGAEPTPFTEYAASDDREALRPQYPYLIDPAHDENPFFFQFVPPWSGWNANLPLAAAIYVRSSNVLFVCVAVAFVLTALLLGVPLLLRRRELAAEPQWAASAVYFGCLGAGFMAFELPVIQVTSLYLGHPTYALSVVLLGLLASAGVGSALMGRLPLRVGRVVPLLVAALAVVSGLGLLSVVHATIHLDDPLRFGATLLYLALIGVPLGMPFVAGIRLLDSERQGQVAWAWAVNGASSVLGSCLWMVVMVYAGSRVCFGLAAVAYLVATLSHAKLASHGTSVTV